MCRATQTALALLAALLPLGVAEAQGRSEWRTRQMGVDIPARDGAVERREFKVEMAGRVFVSWSPDFRSREVEIRVVHHQSGRLLLAKRTCDSGTFSFQAEPCLLEQGKRFDVLVRPLGRTPRAIKGKLFAQRRMKKD